MEIMIFLTSIVVMVGGFVELYKYFFKKEKFTKHMSIYLFLSLSPTHYSTNSLLLNLLFVNAVLILFRIGITIVSYVKSVQK